MFIFAHLYKNAKGIVKSEDSSAYFTVDELGIRDLTMNKIF